MESLLRDLLVRLHSALIAEPFTAEPARSAGAVLVAAGIRRPEALERSLVFLDENLLAAFNFEDYAYRLVMTRMLAGLASGWAGALRESAAGRRLDPRQGASDVRVGAGTATPRRLIRRRDRAPRGPASRGTAASASARAADRAAIGPSG